MMHDENIAVLLLHVACVIRAVVTFCNEFSLTKHKFTLKLLHTIYLRTIQTEDKCKARFVTNVILLR
jgi:hypothetical protein